VVPWLVHRLPPWLGLLWLIPLWSVMAAVAILALRRRGRPWHRDGAIHVLCMIGCAIVAFVPPAFFAGISTSRHMVGMNLATALAFVLSVALAVSMLAQRPARTRPARPAC
jgi:Ca2+/H+ antiporter